MVERVRMIQAGLGQFGRGWAKIVLEAEGVELVGAVDPAAGARDWAVAELGLSRAQVWESLAEALSSTDCDAVVVITPPDTHFGMVVESLAAGCHVLVEKPLATRIEDAREMVAAAERAGRLLMVSQNYRFRSPARAAREAIASGAIGELVAVRARFARDTRKLWAPDNFRYGMRHPVVLDMSIHHADLVRMLTGRNVLRIEARSWRAPDSPYLHDPEVVAVMELEGGVPFVYEGSWAARGEETSWNGNWEVIGQRGRLVWTGGRDDAFTGDILLEVWGKPARLLSLPDLAAVDRAGALREFVGTVRGVGEIETTGEDNVQSLAIVLGCVKSVESGKAVVLAEL